MNIFTYDDYKSYLIAALDASSLRGARSALAKHLACQSGFISQVLNGDRHFSLEHFLEISEFLELNEDETNYLLLMAQKDRAGSEKLRIHYQKQMQGMRVARQRIPLPDSTALTEADLATFHSHWYYYAIYELIKINGKRDISEFSTTLGVGKDKAADSIEVLKKIQLIKEKETGVYEAQPMSVNVGRDASYVNLIHRNFRQEAIRSLDQRKAEDAHYSRYFAATLEESAILQEQLADLVKSFGESIAKNESKGDHLFGLCIDCFRYGKN